MKNYLIISFVILLLISCAGSKEEPVSKIKKPHHIYYLENDLNTNFNLHGPVHTLSRMFIRKDTDSLMVNVFGLPSYPLTEISSYRGFFQFDSLGHTATYYQYNDSLDFVNNTKGGVGVLRFYRTDSLPKKINYKTTYSRNIIQPRMLKLTEASETIGANKITMDAEIDSLDYFSYAYKIEGKKVKCRLKQIILSDGTILPYYAERVEYVYDFLNRVMRENYSYYEILEDWFPPTRASHEYHQVKVGGRDRMHKTYEYNEEGRIAHVVMYINDEYRFEEEYMYDDEGNLVSKIQIDPRWQSTMMRHRSYRTVYHYDQYENILRLDMHNKEGELQGQLWVDYYDFDEYNNWQRCKMFLNNTHEGEATLTGYQKMTYYEE